MGKTFEVKFVDGSTEYILAQYMSVLNAGALEFYNEGPLKIVALYAPGTWFCVREISAAEMAARSLGA